MKRVASISVLLFAAVALGAETSPEKAALVKVVPLNESGNDFRKCRQMLVAPGVTQPEAYPCYADIVSWQSPIVLRDGTMLVGFSSGYWHASPPTDFFHQN